MSEESIFHKVVRKEDSYTQLLANLMKRYPDFRSRMLTLLFSEDLAAKISNSPIQTQRTLTNCGKPDILIEADGLCLIVEVKTELGRHLTENQPCIPDSEGEFRGYIKYLKNQSGKSARWLVYLVPEDWIHKPELDRDIKNAETTSPEISVQVKTWQDVVRGIGKLGGSLPLVYEFRLLLSQRFDTLTFVDTELKMLFRNDFPISAVWTLERLIEAVLKKARGLGYEIDRWTRDTPQRDKEEYAFYFTKGGKYILYFGCYEVFWRNEGFPLCFGIDDPWANDTPGLKPTFLKAVGQDWRACGSYTMGWITEGDLNSLDAVDKVWTRLKSILDQLLALPA